MALVVMATSCLSFFFPEESHAWPWESLGLCCVEMQAVCLSAESMVLSKKLPIALFLQRQRTLCMSIGVQPKQQDWFCSRRLGITEMGDSFVTVVKPELKTSN